MNKIARFSFYPSQPAKKASFYAIVMDIEWYDQTNGNHLTEIGLAIKAQNSIPIYKHFRIKEHASFKNRYAPTPKKGFQFGTSRVLELADVLSEIKYWLEGAGNSCPVELVFHNGTHDRKVLMKNGIDLNAFSRLKVDDTGSLYQRRMNLSKLVSLENLCKALEVPYDSLALHNAGNDSAYTLHCYMVLDKSKWAEKVADKGLEKSEVATQSQEAIAGHKEAKISKKSKRSAVASITIEAESLEDSTRVSKKVKRS